MKLQLACGQRPKPGFINTDMVKLDGVDVVHDLNVTPWPWDDNTFTLVEGFDIFEHVDNPIAFITECHRILKPGKYLHLHTSYWRNPDSYTDPTHKRFCTENTFDYWCEGTFLYERYNLAYGAVNFEKIDVHVGADNYLDVTLKKTSGRPPGAGVPAASRSPEPARF